MVSVKDVAAKAGVARSTTSLVLSGRGPELAIAEATQQRIMRAAVELDYHPNQIARAMATGQTKAIGFLGSTLSNEYTARMLDGAVRVAQAGGYLVKLLHTNNGATEQNALHIAIQQRLAGVISVHADEAFLKTAQAELARHAVPLVILDHTTLNLGSRPAPAIRVISDDAQGMADAVTHLATLGHTRIALLSVAKTSSGWIARENGYRQAMRKMKLPVRANYVQAVGSNVADYRDAALKLLKLPERPTAIACVSDIIAMATLRTARAIGLRVPRDLSVIGFADLEMAQHADPPLTTVFQPFGLMGEVAAKRLLAAIEGKAKPSPQPEMLPTRLTVRESTGPVNTRAGYLQSCGHVPKRIGNTSTSKTKGDVS
ncbi:MAG: LacI family DNA-binding transcriptional regulator [Kiritimatiellae bacterium]|nr:LacI family DNA-binding transcriptional regulator [Kiritimatiellia bacterium]